MRARRYRRYRGLLGPARVVRRRRQSRFPRTHRHDSRRRCRNYRSARFSSLLRSCRSPVRKRARTAPVVERGGVRAGNRCVGFGDRSGNGVDRHARGRSAAGRSRRCVRRLGDARTHHDGAVRRCRCVCNVCVRALAAVAPRSHHRGHRRNNFQDSGSAAVRGDAARLYDRSGPPAQRRFDAAR
jgi:hypothetical protein